jgi:hypothetical protein
VVGSEAKTGNAYPRIPPIKAIAQPDARTLLLVSGGDGIYSDETQVPNLIKYDLISGETTDLGRFIDNNGVPGWIPQCAVYSAEEDSLYVGLQQAACELRLWRISLHRRPEDKETPDLISVSGVHEQRVSTVPFGSSVQGANTLPYMHAGNVSMLELGWFGEGKIIPAGESAISDLRFVGNVLYGITRGRRSHLFRYAPYAYNRFVENYDVHVCDLGVIVESPVSGGRLIYQPTTDQLVLFLKVEKAIEVLLYDRLAENKAYHPHYHSVPHWDPFSFRTAPWTLWSSWNLNDFSLTDLIYDYERNHVWSVNNGGELVCVQLSKAAVSSSGIFVLPNTCVFAGQDLFAVSGQGEAVLIDVSGRPAIRRSIDHSGKPGFTCCVYSEPSSHVVLGTADGKLLIYDARIGVWKGQADVASKVRALAPGRSGVVYGFCGEDNGIGEPFVLDLASCQARRLGILQVKSDPRFWINHRCDCLAIGRNGEVYFGEADRISHLLVYCPPSDVNDTKPSS